MALQFRRDRITSEFLNLTFTAEDYEIKFDQLSEGEEEDQFTGKFRVRSRSLPARVSRQEASSSRRSSTVSHHSTGAPGSSRDQAVNASLLENVRQCPSDEGGKSVHQSGGFAHGRASKDSQDAVWNSRKASTRRGSSLSEKGAPATAKLQRTSRAGAQEASSGCSQTEGSEIWDSKSGDVRMHNKRSKKDSSKGLRPASRSDNRNSKAEFCIAVQPVTAYATGRPDMGNELLDRQLHVEIRTWGPDTNEDPFSHGCIVWADAERMEIYTMPGESELHFEICRREGGEVCPPEGFTHAKVALDGNLEDGRRHELQVNGACLVVDIAKKPLLSQPAKKGGLTWDPNLQETRQFAGNHASRRNTPFLARQASIQEEEPPMSADEQSSARSGTKEDASRAAGPSNLSQPISMQLDLPEARRATTHLDRTLQEPGSAPRASQGPRRLTAPAAPKDAGSSGASSGSSEPVKKRRSSSQRWRIFHGQEKDSWRDPIRRSKSQPSKAATSMPNPLDTHLDKPVQMQVDASDQGSIPDVQESIEESSLESPFADSALDCTRQSRESRASRLSRVAPRQSRLCTSMLEAEFSDRGSRGSAMSSLCPAPCASDSARAKDSRPSRGEISLPRASLGASRVSGSRGSRLSSSKLQTRLQCLQWVSCRYTEPQAVTFCGLCEELGAMDLTNAEGITGRDRTTLLVLLEQAEHSVTAVRRQKSAADAATMPRLLASLSAEFVLHAREIRGGHLQTVCEEPVLLLVLRRLIEVLDTLVPQEDGTADAVAFAAPDAQVMGGEATLQYTESVLESLRQAFGPHGFLPECISCLGRNLNKKELHERKLGSFIDQMDILALLALRLAMPWETPSTVPRPVDIAQQNGVQAVLERFVELLEQIKSGSGKAVQGILGQLALVLDTLFIMLRSDSGLERLCDATLLTSGRRTAQSRGSGSGSMAPLASLTLETIELLVEYADRVSVQSLQIGLPAAVRILTLLLDAAAADLFALVDRFVKACCQIVSDATLTTRLLLALVDMVKTPSKPRTWFGSVTEASNLRRKLRSSFIRSKMPSQVAIAAKEKLESLLQDSQNSSEVSLARVGVPLSKALAKRARQVIAAGAFYDAVEEFVYEVYGTSSALDDEMSDLRSAYEDLDANGCDDGAGYGRKRASGMLHALGNMRQSILTSCLMPQGRRRSFRRASE